MSHLFSDPRVQKLFDAAHKILRDECPDQQPAYFCVQSEDYDPTVCERCWDNWLYRIINREVE